MPLSTNKIKFIKSLEQKKVRNELGLFIAEGEKIVGETLKSNARINSLFATAEWLNENELNLKNKKIEITEVSEKEFERISLLSTPNKVLAIVEKINFSFNKEEIISNLSLALDEIKDPGNLGTIIRIADWFGIENIICSDNTVELYNPKVIQATMGSFLRVKIHYLNLNNFISEAKNKIPIYATTLDGENIYEQKLSDKGIILIGNESKGISEELIKQATHKISIPNFSRNKSSAESLNASVATAVICSEFTLRLRSGYKTVH